jgi:serine/threonine protein kinase
LTCLKEDEVIAIVSGAMAGEALENAEAHIDVCRACRLLLSALAKRTGELSNQGHISAFSSGDVIAERYRVMRLIGAGGMGEVYETQDLELGERVALKTIAIGARLDAKAMVSLKAEVQLARRVTHRNVCRVFDVGYHHEASSDEASGDSLVIPFFTMELLPGETLGQLLRRQGPCSPEEALQLVSQVGSGLEALHHSGVIHSDLKSDNIMLVPEASGTRVVITDLGLAMLLDGSARKTGRGLAVGTIGYMAPEQFGNHKTSRRTDIYALGVILYELLTGHLPFSPQALAASAHEHSPPSPSVSSLDVPSVWVAIIERCMAISPSARFGSVEELLRALRLATKVHSPRRWTHLVVGAGFAAALLGSTASLTMVVLGRRNSNIDVLPLTRIGRDARADSVVPALQAPESVRPDAAPAGLSKTPETTRSATATPLPAVRSRRPKRPSRVPIEKPSPKSNSSPSRPGEDDMIDPRGWR